MKTFATFYKEKYFLTEAKNIWYNIPIHKLNERDITPQTLEVIYEGWAGLKSLASAARTGMQQAGQALKPKIQQYGSRAMEFGTQVARGAREAGGQVVQNVKDIYRTGELEKETGEMAQRTKDESDFLRVSLDEIQEFIQDTVEHLRKTYPELRKSLNSDPSRVTLGAIEKALQFAISKDEQLHQGAKDISKAAKEKGFFGGAGEAFKKGYAPTQPPTP